jgi:copper oxidase (laccase) domain-containing protein
LRGEYSTDPADLKAVISPSLGPCCAEFINHRTELPEAFHCYQRTPNFFNFWEISKKQLSENGVHEKNIAIIGRCTACDEDYFSYRRDRKSGNRETGRNGSLIALPQHTSG